MTGTIRIFRKWALKQAFEAGMKSAIANPDNWKEAFDAGERKGSSWLNEAVHAQTFYEFMADRRIEAPKDFEAWIQENEKKMAIPVIREEGTAAEAAKDVIVVRAKETMSMEDIEKAVSENTGVSIESLQGNRRRLRAIKTPRYLCYYMAYFHCENRLEDIGHRWGQKDHATAIHGVKQIANNARTYPADKSMLVNIYISLWKRGFDIDKFTNVKTGRKIVEPIKINI